MTTPEPKGGTYTMRDPETGQVVRVGRSMDLERRFNELQSIGEPSAEVALMPEDQFWSLIQQARRQSSENSTLANTLELILEGHSSEEILGFHHQLWRLMGKAHRDDLWAIGYIINGGASSDGFCYFRAWLIAQGDAVYNAALANPGTVAAVVRPGETAEYEDLLGAAVAAYHARTGHSIWDVASPLPEWELDEPSWTEADLRAQYADLLQEFAA